MSILACTSCRFAEHTQAAIFQDPTNETLLRAFVEGNAAQGCDHSHNTEVLLQGLRSERNSNDAGFLLGPLYWGYRKCLIEVIPLIVLFGFVTLLFGWLCAPIGPFLLYFIPAFFFFPVYRARAKRVIRTALKKNFKTDDELIAYVRKRGGTSIWYAFIAGILFIAIVAFGVIVIVGAR